MVFIAVGARSMAPCSETFSAAQIDLASRSWKGSVFEMS